MNRSKLNSQLFDSLLKAAVEENLTDSLKGLPPDEILNRDYAPSPELAGRIRKLEKKRCRRELLRRTGRISKKVAVLAAVIIPVSVGSLLSVEASRNAIFNAVIQWGSDHANLFYQSASSAAERPKQEKGSDQLYLPDYIPRGFTLSDKESLGNIVMIIYRNQSDNEITFQQSVSSQLDRSVIDSEHTTYQGITINGQKASLFVAKTAEDRSFLCWQTNKTNFMLTSNIDPKELVKMAEQTRKQK